MFEGNLSISHTNSRLGQSNFFLFEGRIRFFLESRLRVNSIRIRNPALKNNLNCLELGPPAWIWDPIWTTVYPKRFYFFPSFYLKCLDIVFTHAQLPESAWDKKIVLILWQMRNCTGFREKTTLHLKTSQVKNLPKTKKIFVI